MFLKAIYQLVFGPPILWGTMTHHLSKTGSLNQGFSCPSRHCDPLIRCLAQPVFYQKVDCCGTHLNYAVSRSER